MTPSASLQHRMRQRFGRIDPVAVQADIGSRGHDLVDREPFDEQRVRLVEQAREHVDPARRSSVRRAVAASAPPLRCAPRSWVESSAASSSSFLASALASASIGRLRSIERGGEVARFLGEAVDERRAIGFERLAGILLGARQHLLADERRGRLPPAPSGMPAWMRRVQPGPGRAARRGERLRQQFSAASSSAMRSPIRSARPAPAPARRFRPANPAPELGGLEAPVRWPGEGAVGGIEKMVAFIEDEPAQAAGRGFLLLGAGDAERLVDGRLMQHQRMIGDDDDRPLRGARPRAR